jgi:hypothetical protein
MTAQPYQPAADRSAIDADLVIVPEDAASRPDDAVGPDDAGGPADLVTGPVVTSTVVEADAVGDDACPTGENAADFRPTDLGGQWHDIQAMFVDDPPGSVQRAAAAADAAVSALAELLRERQAALSPAGGNSADTEQLRETLRNYRILCQNLADLGSQLQQSRP